MLKLPPPVIRPIRPADAPVLAVIHGQVFQKSWDASALLGLLPCADGRVALDADGDILGFLLWQQTGAEADLLTLAVAPAHQRCGVGRQLVAQMLETLAQNGGEQVFLEVGKENQAAVGLYTALGFQVVGERRNYYTHKPPAARDAWTLMRRLPCVWA